MRPTGSHRPTRSVSAVEDVEPFAVLGEKCFTRTSGAARAIAARHRVGPARVAVTGLGIIGNLAAQVFDSAGYVVLACDPVEHRRELLAGRGIELRERLPLDDSAWEDHIDLVVECSGHEAAVLDGCRMVRRGGEVALVGAPWRRRTEIPAFDVFHVVFHNYAHLRSGWEWEVPREATDHRCGNIRDNLTAAMRWFGEGRLRGAGAVRLADPRDCQQVYDDLLG